MADDGVYNCDRRGRNALAKYVESSMQLKAGLEYRIFCS
jgi:hypothetical protein